MFRMKHRCYSSALKKAIVELNEEGKSVKYLSHNYSVSESAIYRWIKSANSVEEGDKGDTPKGGNLKSENSDVQISLTLIVGKRLFE